MLAPFTGLLYDPTLIPDVGAATAPPYDVIDEAARQRYLAASPHNIVHLLLPPQTEHGYEAAAALFGEWRAEGALVPDPTPRLYLYVIDHPRPDGGVASARGLIGALELHEWGRLVEGHEETQDKVRADRLNLLRTTEANLDLIIALTPATEIMSIMEPAGPPRVDFSADGVRHRLYDIADPEQIAFAAKAIGAHPVIMADGHHRYNTALRYRELYRPGQAGPWDSILAFVAPTAGSGLHIDAVHRAFPLARFDAARISAAFSVAPAPVGPPKRAGDIVVVRHSGEALLLRPKPDALAAMPKPLRAASVAVARDLLFPLVELEDADAEYIHGTEAALEWLDLWSGGAVALMAPVPEDAVGAAGRSGLRFPTKTTYFAPKPRAGLVMRAFDLG